MISKSIVASMGLAAAAFALPASAQGIQTQNFYAGISVGQAKYNDVCNGLSGFSCDEKDTAFRIFGGYQFHPNIGVELGYADLGKAKFSGTFSGIPVNGTEEFSAFDLVAVGSWPVTAGLSLFGKLGMYHGTVKATANSSFGGSGNADDSGNDFTYGLGAGYDFTRNVGARIEWQRYNGFSDANNLDVISLGVLYRFR